MNKKQLATLFRQTAANIEKYGWVKGEYGDQHFGFCAVGSLAFSAGTDPDSLGETSAFEVESGTYIKIQSPVPIHCSKATARKVLGVKTLKGNLKQVANTFSFITFNDSRPDGEEGQKQVTKFFRGLARHLEHGGDL
jgi:hypothetical protein